MTEQQVRQQLHRDVIAKLRADGLTLRSPWPEIEDCLKDVVMPTKCIAAARELVEAQKRYALKSHAREYGLRFAEGDTDPQALTLLIELRRAIDAGRGNEAQLTLQQLTERQ